MTKRSGPARQPTASADDLGSGDARSARIARERQELERGGKLSRLRWIVLLLSLSLTLLASLVTKHEVEARAESTFARERDRSLALLQEQLRHYEGALWRGVAAIQANGGSMTDTQWKIYAETLDIVDKYPGAKGIGYIQSVPVDEADTFVAEQRRTRPDFEIHPVHPGSCRSCRSCRSSRSRPIGRRWGSTSPTRRIGSTASRWPARAGLPG